MKKYEFPNNNLKIEFIETHNKEVTEERKKEYESKLAKIPTIEGKLKFTETELVEYEKNASAEVLFISGSVIAQGVQPEAHLFWAHYLNTNIQHLKKQLEKETSKKKANAKELPTSFDELVRDDYTIQPFIDILKEVDPPLIDVECNYIGKSKGAICVWIDEMRRQAIIEHCSDRKQLVMLISQKIKNFSMDDRMFSNYHTKAENTYRNDFKALISKYKISSKK